MRVIKVTQSLWKSLFSALVLAVADTGVALGEPVQIDLLRIDDTDGIRFDGADTSDLTAFWVERAGDVNADGIDDLMIGATGADPLGRLDAGMGYLLFGRDRTDDPFPPSIDLEFLEPDAGRRLLGAAAGDQAGRTLGRAGDINADGIGDFYITAAFSDSTGTSSTGSTFVLFGPVTDDVSTDIDLANLQAGQGLRIDGMEESDLLGSAATAAGDFNGDGIDDLIIGAAGVDANQVPDSGAAFLLFGRNQQFPDLLNITDFDGSFGIEIAGAASGDFLGNGTSGVGDLNGDALDDLVLTAPTSDPSGRVDAGRVYVVFGDTNLVSDAIDVALLDGNNGFRIDGNQPGDGFGISVTSSGDFNGDGAIDLAIGASRASPNGRTEGGAAYVFFGPFDNMPPVVDLQTAVLPNLVQLQGTHAGDRLGFSVRFLGDVNGDGIDDLGIGAFGASPIGRNSAGGAYLLMGGEGNRAGLSAIAPVANFETSRAVFFAGAAVGDFTGFSIGAADDADNDGINDLLIGAFRGNDNTGRAYLIRGRDFEVLFEDSFE